MKYIGIAKSLISLLHWIGLPLVFLYFFSMFFYPWIEGQWSWIHTQEVWDRWQSLNVGMLAFISSVIAFNIARFNAERQREREFLAAKSFLPAAFSDLIRYFKSSALVLSKGWNSGRAGVLKSSQPKLPADYKIVFEECIRHAEPDVGEYLSKILAKLQVHHSRITNLVDEINSHHQNQPDKANLITYLYRLGELQALINKIFEFARGDERFDTTSLDWEDFRNAYQNLDLRIDDIYIDEDMNIEKFTKRKLKN